MPTKPINPLAETAVAVARVAAPIAMIRILFGEIPNEYASSSLSNKPSRSRDMRIKINSAISM
jgi:hypothetical protein